MSTSAARIGEPEPDYGAARAAVTFTMPVSALLALWMTHPMSELRDRAQQILHGRVPADQGRPEASGEIGDLVDVFREVTITRERAMQSQAEMVEQMRAILNNASVGILFTRAGRFELLGHHMCQILGYAEHGLKGHPVRLIYPSDEAYAELGDRVRALPGTLTHEGLSPG